MLQIRLLYTFIVMSMHVTTSSGKSVVSSSLSSSSHSGANGRRLEAYRDVPRDEMFAFHGRE